MRVLIATGIYPPDIGGPATYSKLLFEELPKRGLRVGILSFGEVRKWPKIVRHFVYFLKVLRAGRQADVIYAQDPVSVGLPACLASKILGKKFILKVVGDYAWEQYQQKKGVGFVLPENFQNKKFDFVTEIRRKIERSVAKGADKVIIPSEYLKKIVLMWGVAEDKTKVIYNAFEMLDGVHYDVHESFNIVSVGRLVSWKGFDILIEIMPKILKETPDAKLIIIGDGPEKENLESKIKDLKLNDNILLTGQLSQEEVLRYLNKSDLFVLNTGYEGLSHVILEAMAMEIPVITTNVGGNPELIKNNENGFLVEYNNKEQIKKAILDLYKNKDMREKFIKNSKERVREFNKEKMIEGVINVLKS